MAPITQDLAKINRRVDWLYNKMKCLVDDPMSAVLHNNLSDLQGGDPILKQFYHLTLGELEGLQELISGGGTIPSAQQVFTVGSEVNINDSILLYTEGDVDFQSTNGGAWGIGSSDGDQNAGVGGSYNEASISVSKIDGSDYASLRLLNYSGVSAFEFYDGIYGLGATYLEDYTDEQLLNDRAITDVGGVKKLIQDNLQGLQSVLDVNGVASTANEVSVISQNYINFDAPQSYFGSNSSTDSSNAFINTDSSTGSAGINLAIFGAGTPGLGNMGFAMSTFDGFKIIDNRFEIGFLYSGDYTVNQLLNDRAITDVGGVKQLISTAPISIAIQDALDLKADITYVDGLVSNVFRAAGNWDASVGTFPTTGTGTGGAIRRGDTFRITVAGTMGGILYDVGDSFYANTPAPGQTVGNWSKFESNVEQATASYRGTMFLYTGTGTNTNGTITQAGINTALGTKVTKGGDAGVLQIGTTNNSVFNLIQNNVARVNISSTSISFLDNVINGASSASGTLTFGTASTTTLINRNVNDAFTAVQFENSNLTSAANIVDFSSNIASVTAVRAGVRKDGRMFGTNGSLSNDYYTFGQAGTALALKQDVLVSGTTIKTVGGQSLLGSGNITEVQNSLSASTILAPSVTAVNTALALKANDADVVYKAGTQTITGNKTFTGDVIMPDDKAIFYGTDKDWASYYSVANGGLSFDKTAVAAGVLFIKDNLNVGVGTVNPTAKLHITGGALMAGSWRRVETLTADYPALVYESTAGSFGGIGYDGGIGGAMTFWVNSPTNDVPTGMLALRIFHDASAVFSGDVELDVVGKSLIQKSPNGTRWRILVSDTGVLSTTLA